MDFLEQTVFTSNESTITLFFRTDMSVVYKGWNLTYHSGKAVKVLHILTNLKEHEILKKSSKMKEH